MILRNIIMVKHHKDMKIAARMKKTSPSYSHSINTTNAGPRTIAHASQTIKRHAMSSSEVRPIAFVKSMVPGTHRI